MSRSLVEEPSYSEISGLQGLADSSLLLGIGETKSGQWVHGRVLPKHALKKTSHHLTVTYSTQMVPSTSAPSPWHYEGWLGPQKALPAC